MSDITVILRGPAPGQEALLAVAHYLGFEVVTDQPEVTAEPPQGEHSEHADMELTTILGEDLSDVGLTTVGDVMRLTLMEAWRALMRASRGNRLAAIAAYMAEHRLQCADGPVQDVARAEYLLHTRSSQVLPALGDRMEHTRLRHALANNGILVHRMLEAASTEELDDIPQVTRAGAMTAKRLLAEYKA